MYRLFGIETEYGISVEGRGAADLIRESIGVVQAVGVPCATGWNYRGEDPRRDMRGFTVDHLSTDADDAQFDEPGKPPMSGAEERSDRILANGARLYNDHGHPEYATPECSNLHDLVAADRAGERIVFECAHKRGLELRAPVVLYKNNTDYHGASYGTHEDYLVRREVPADALIAGLIPFLVTRQIYAGAGKVGVEGETHTASYQLSQRADYVSVEASVDTLANRPIVNTRDEPHATPREFRRLHVIIGDANMSEWATAMKVGTTALVAGLLELGWRPDIALDSPVRAIKEVSRDASLRWLVRLRNGSTMPAVDVQRLYLAAAKEMLAGSSADADWTLGEWEAVLDDLERTVLATADRVDWVAKRQLLEHYMAEAGVGWDAEVLKALDLSYHDLDPEMGLHAGLEQAGAMRRIVTDEQIDAAMACPPPDTRAAIRGLFIRRFGQAVRSIGWNGIAFAHAGEDYVFDMNPLVGPGVRLLNEELADAASLDDVVAVMRREPR